MTIDFIGDVHGHLEPLTALLRRLGYRRRGGTWKQARHTAVFLGDYLNRGPAIREAVDLVRAMTEAGSAIALLGNHDLNALLHDAHGPRRKGWHLPESHQRHLRDSLAAYRGRRREWNRVLDWLFTLPLWWDGGTARAVHACWAADAIRELATQGGPQLMAADIDRPDQGRGPAIHLLLNGAECTLPASLNGGAAKTFRIRWWMEGAATWRSAGYPPQLFLPRRPLPARCRAAFHPYRASEPPLFFGHYGFLKPGRPIRANLACLDLAVTRGGPLAAYRWEGEPVLTARHFVLSK